MAGDTVMSTCDTVGGYSPCVTHDGGFGRWNDTVEYAGLQSLTMRRARLTQADDVGMVVAELDMWLVAAAPGL